MSSTEKATQKAVLDYLTAKGIFHWRQNSGAIKTRGHFYKFASINGIPDIVAIVNGQFIGLEIKDIDGKQNDDQIEFQRLLEESGGKYYVIRSIDEVIQLF